MVLLGWLGWLTVAGAAETDCVTKDLTWRWLSVSPDGGGASKDRWVHGSKVLVDGNSDRITWNADQASIVPFRKHTEGGTTVETFKWKVTVSAKDGKALGEGVTDPKVELEMHCQRTTGGKPPPAAAGAVKKAMQDAKAKAAPAPAAPAPAPAKPAPAPEAAKPAPAPAPAPKP
ncbi:MAG: hypothetical protein R3F59_27065 [Myxococcota bacterium]